MKTVVVVAAATATIAAIAAAALNMPLSDQINDSM